MNERGLLFSVLIPAFKAKYLRECIDSILNQSYSRLEVIIVNDASPEDLDSIVQGYNDERIKYYVNENNFGAVDVVLNWNKCLEYATGDYVICMGDDDCLKPNCLEVYNKLLESRPGTGLLHGWTEIINDESVPYLMTTHRCEYESDMSLLWHRVFAYKAQFIGDFCFKRSSLVNNGGFYYFPLAWGSDEVSTVIAAKENGVLNTQEVVFQYRRSPLTITSTGNIPVKMKALNQKLEWMKIYLSETREDPVDELYRRELVSHMTHYEERKKSDSIISDIRQNGISRSFYWLFHNKEYKLKTSTLLYSIIRSLV